MKIKYGISNLHYAVATAGTGGALTYGTPVAMPGAVALSLDAAGETIHEYADNVDWFTQMINAGYTGSLEVESLPDSFRTDVLGEILDSNGVLFESAEAPMIEFALLFQFEVSGDTTVTGKRGVFFRCTASRPTVGGNTKNNTISPDHETINITALPRINDHMVKASCVSTSAAYASWFSSVVQRSTSNS